MGSDDDQPCDLLFVYGTLMSRFQNVHAVALRQAATLVGAATYRGKMHRVSGPRGVLVYPVVVPSENPTDVVHGELYRLHDRRVLDRLDRYEGCATDSPPPHEYRREVCEVKLASGGPTVSGPVARGPVARSPVEAMLYLFQGSTLALPRIADGVFR